MKVPTPSKISLLVRGMIAAAIATSTISSLPAQQAKPAPAPVITVADDPARKPEKVEEVVELSPFVVTSGSDQGYILGSYDETHILTVVGSYRLPFGFELGARFRYVTGRPKSLLQHTEDLFRADANEYTGQFGPPRAGRVKDFNQLDLRIDKAFVFEKWTLGVFLDIQNVYNAKNVEGSFFDYRSRQEFDVSGIPFLPVLGVKGSF